MARRRPGMRAASCCGMVALGLLASFMVLCWDLVWGHYSIWRLERARTFEEARSSFESIEASAAHSAYLKDVILAKLCPERPRLTFWFFALLDTGNVRSSALIERFGKALEEREELSRCWSHFVRWRFGEDLWSRLRSVGKGFLAGRGDAILCWGLPREPSVGSKPDLSSTVRKRVLWSPLFGSDQAIANLRIYGILWFLGISRPSPFEGGNLTRELLQHRFIYDGRIDRCRAYLDSAESFTLKALNPASPLREWEGPVPDLPAPDFKDASRHQLILKRNLASSRSYDGTLYDGIWPLPRP